MTAAESLQRLQEGNSRFVQDTLEGKFQDGERRAALLGGQAPYAIVLGCADSRVVPELAFDAGIGELFTVRVAGNIANTDAIASIEYAVAHLDTKLIVVLGHQKCGAVAAAVAGGDNGPNLNHLLAQISPAIESAGENASVNEVVKKNATLNATNLLNNSTIIKNAVEASGVEIKAAYYHLDTGEVEFL
jgi:carbonic anhydrase